MGNSKPNDPTAKTTETIPPTTAPPMGAGTGNSKTQPDPNIDPTTGLPIDNDPSTDEPGFDLDSNGNVDVAGLKVPGALAVQIVDAMRALYPSVTDGLGDVRAVRAVLKYWVTATVSTYAAQLATADTVQQVNALQADAEAKRGKAKKDAEAAAAAITEAPPTPQL